MSVGMEDPSRSNFQVPIVVWSIMGSSKMTAVLLGNWSRWKLDLSLSLEILLGLVSCTSRMRCRRSDLPVLFGHLMTKPLILGSEV